FIYKFKRNIDVFHCYLYATSIGVFLGLLNFKIVYEVTSPDAARKFIKKSWLWRFIYNQLFRIHCVSRSVYEVLLNELVLNNFKLESPIVYSSTPYTRVRLEHPINIDEKQNIIVYACRFIDRKNVVFFARVAKELLFNFKDW